MGEPFELLKIRTMRVGTEKSTALGVQQTSSAITPIGRLLRELKLDELPQLWNIVRGDMELVGPRPIPVALYEELRQKISNFELRNTVKPGLSNVSQVSILDNKLDDQLIADWSRRLEGELHYISNKCFAYDVLVVVMTLLFMLKKIVWLVLRRKDKGVSQADESRNEIFATNIVGIPISNLGYDGVIEKMAGWISQREQRYIGVCPVHSIIESRWNTEHRSALLNADLNTPDGMPVVWMARLLGHLNASRVYGPTLFMKTLQRAEEEGWRIAFYGGHPDRLPVLIDRLIKRFPNLKIVEQISPPFRPLSEQEDEEYTERLNTAEPDITWVGIGSPKQEIWMSRHTTRVPGVMVGVGAAFDFHAGFVKTAPPFLQKIGMEWAFRLWCEPRRLFKRYLTANPVFIVLAIRQMFAYWLIRKSYQTTMCPPYDNRKIELHSVGANAA